MKIVTLLPSATEIACSLGLRKSLIAVSHECDFPNDVTSLPRITSSIIPDNLSTNQIDASVEKAVRNGDALYQINGDLLSKLKPDLIITQGICDVCAVNVGTVQETMLLLPDLVKKNVQILSLSGKNFSGILNDINQVAVATKTQNEANRLTQKLREHWQQLQQTQSMTKPAVLMLEWPNPFFFGGHWVPEMIEVAGGVDVMGKTGLDSGRCTFKEIQEKDPDIIISIACGHDLEQNVKFANKLVADPEFRELRAVQKNNVWAMDANSYCSRPAPRIVEGTEKLRAIFNNKGKGVEGIERILQDG